MDKPVPRGASFDPSVSNAFYRLRDLAAEYVDFHDGPDWHEDSDLEHYIFEAAIEMFYGDGVWEWINSVEDRRK